MDLSGLTQYLSLVVMGICLCVGFVIKNSLDFIEIKPDVVNNIFILLHGYGSNNEDFLRLGEHFRDLFQQ